MARTLSAAGRDARIIGIISVAHLFSHFYQLALPSMFPLMTADTGLSFTQLGLIGAVFYTASGLCQTPAGFLVDRIGARPVLFAGLGLLATASTLIAFAPNYTALLMLGALAGMGNSVFHPADYSMMNSAVSSERMGRAYSVHAIGGHVGFALAPPVMVLLGTTIGWRNAMLAAGLVGIVLVIGLVIGRDALQDGHRERRAAAAAGNADDAPRGVSVLLQPKIAVFFLYFLAMAGGLIGLQGFTGMELTFASIAITCFLVGVPTGVAFGGIVADRRPGSHDMVAFGAMTFAALALAPVSLFLPGTAALFALMAVAGFAFGFGMPSRDMVIRAATPRGAMGRVFGFVYSGLDAGCAIAPPIFGLFIDLGLGRWVFLLAAGFLLVSGLLIGLSRARRDAAPA
jgi:FSR family fosmidomycin resistance protein-like MFS transporter